MKTALLKLFLILCAVVSLSSFVFTPTSHKVYAATKSYFYYKTNRPGVVGEGICETSEDKCNGSLQDRATYYGKRGKPTADTTQFQGSISGQTAYITVQDCTPSTGSIRIGTGNEKSIKINGDAGKVRITCQTQPPGGSESVGTKIARVQATFFTDANFEKHPKIGPVKFELRSVDGKTIIATKESPIQDHLGSSVPFEVDFQNIEPGTYQFCVPLLKTDCKTRTKTKGQILFVDFIGQAKDSFYTDVAGTEDGVTCESSGGSLSWIFCPVIEGLAEASDGIYNSFIQPLLETPGVDVGDDSTTRQVWDQMRLYGNIILVIGMLVVVFGQAIGGGLVDAYTAKKVLPRILIAAILLNLSLYIVAVIIDITNLLGRSLNDLIISPFEEIGQATYKIGDAAAGLGLTGMLLGAGGTGLLIAAGGLGIIIQFLLLFILLPAFLAFIGIMGTLILRMGIIQFLVIISPIAFALYCLPNTEKYFKQWWNLLFKTAMVYPIVAVIFAMTDVLFLTIGQANTGILGDVVKIVVLIIPLFLIPFAFKMSGGAMGAIYGAINNASAPGKNLLKGTRQKAMGRRLEDLKGGNLIRNAQEGTFGHKFNRALMGASLIGRAGFKPSLMRGNISSGMSARDRINRDKMLNDEEYVAKMDDDLSRAMSETNNADELRHYLTTNESTKGRYVGPGGQANLERDIGDAESMRKKYGNSSFRQAAWMRAVAGGTAFKEEEGSAAPWLAAAKIAGGNGAVLSDLVGQGKGLAMNAGRVEHGGAAFGKIMEVASKLRSGDMTMDQASAEITKGVIDSQGAGILSHSSMKPQAIRALIPEFQRRIDAAVTSGDPAQIDAELANVANLKDALSASAPQLIDEFEKGVMMHPVSATGTSGAPLTVSVSQALEARRGSEVFRARRREYPTVTEDERSRRPPAGPGGPSTTPPTTPETGL